MSFNRLVLSGGGLKGLAYIGMLKFIEETPEKFKNIKEYVGTSIGAMMCMLIALGYNSVDLLKIFNSLDIEKLRNPKVSTFFENYGLDNGDNIEKLLKILIKNKGHPENLTLRELYNINSVNLVVCTTNVSTKKCKYFNYIDDPEIPIHLIVRMSMCIPMIFSPIKYNGEHYVDGALTNDFPVNYPTETPEKCICVRLLTETRGSSEIKGIESYMRNLLKIAFNSNIAVNESLAIREKMHVVKLPIEYTNTVNFEITSEQKLKIYERGYSEFSKFFI